MSIRSTNPTDYISNNTDSPNRIIHELRNIDRTLQGSNGALQVTASVTGSPNVTVTNGAGNPVPVTLPPGAFPLPTGASTEATLSALNDKVSANQFLYQKGIAKNNGQEVYIKYTLDTNHSSVVSVEILDKNYVVLSTNPEDYLITDDLAGFFQKQPDATDSLVNQNDVVSFSDLPVIYSSGVIRMRTQGTESARVDIISEDLNGNRIGVPYERSVNADIINGTVEITLSFNLQQTQRLTVTLAENTTTSYDRIYLMLSTLDKSIINNIVRSEELQIDVADFDIRYSTHPFLNKNYTQNQITKSLLAFVGGAGDTNIITELVNANSTLNTLSNNSQTLGIKTNVNSSPVVISSQQTTDLITTHSATALLNENLFIDGLGSASFDTHSNGTTYREFSIQVISAAGTLGGAIIFEGSNDNFATAPILLSVFDDTTNTGAVLSGAQTITQNTSRFFVGETAYKYVRCRVSTAPTGTSTLRAITKWGIIPSTHRTVVVAQPTAANLQCTATMTIAGTALNANATPAAGTTTRAMPTATIVLGTFTDANSLARTTSGNSGTVADDYGNTISSVINVSATSGTGQTLDIALEQSSDGGTTWQAIYHVRRITATGAITVPKMTVNGRRRWSWVITGTTPSFTFGILSSRPQVNADTIRNFFDRTITAILNSTSNAFDIEETKCTMFFVNSGAATTPAQYQLQVSNDTVAGWSNVGTAVTSVASSVVASSPTPVNAKFARIICTSAGTGQTINFVNINSIS
jgi:hypothetical protein